MSERSGVPHSATDLSEIIQSLKAEIRSLKSGSDLPRHIELCRRGLALVNRLEHPKDIVFFSMVLAQSLMRSDIGNLGENIEEAIDLLESLIREGALGIDTQSERWAWIHHALALAHEERGLGDRAQNLEQAMHHYNEALKVYNREDRPGDWAKIQVGLAGVYEERIQGDRAENLESAIHHATSAQEIFTKESHLKEWATMEGRKAFFCRKNLVTNPDENLRLAIQHFHNAMEFYTRDEDPEFWADLQCSLGDTYRSLLMGDVARHLELAIQHYQNALQIYNNPDDYPQEWREISECLAAANEQLLIGLRMEGGCDGIL